MRRWWNGCLSSTCILERPSVVSCFDLRKLARMDKYSKDWRANPSSHESFLRHPCTTDGPMLSMGVWMPELGANMGNCQWRKPSNDECCNLNDMEFLDCRCAILSAPACLRGSLFLPVAFLLHYSCEKQPWKRYHKVCESL